MGVKSYPLIVNTLFEDNENEDHLFALKLALFEVPAIKDSKDDEKKKALRTCTSKLDVLKVTLEFFNLIDISTTILSNLVLGCGAFGS